MKIYHRHLQIKRDKPGVWNPLHECVKGIYFPIPIFPKAKESLSKNLITIMQETNKVQEMQAEESMQPQTNNYAA